MSERKRTPSNCISRLEEFGSAEVSFKARKAFGWDADPGTD